MRELPIACSLSAGDLRARLAEMASVGRLAFIDADRDGRAARLRFRCAPDVAERLSAIVAAEGECCAFLSFKLAGEGSELLLSIDGPEGSGVVVDELVAAFAADRRARAGQPL